jgi:hypothetical protein
MASQLAYPAWCSRIAGSCHATKNHELGRSARRLMARVFYGVKTREIRSAYSRSLPRVNQACRIALDNDNFHLSHHAHLLIGIRWHYYTSKLDSVNAG